ncbi:transcription accessory protein [Klebsiella pneumoniae]|uniref:Transcription accessory protein n=1 Tax=Klebsiella pneumoniae TaxID=573 RepID=A0A4P0YIJ5_KLEPN|nr:transcription accessory protein [Klebsiella pneumoniae]
MGLDPGLRTGVKVAVVDATGKLVATDTIYPHTGQAPKRPSPSPRCVRSTTLSWWPSATVPPRVKPSVSSSTCRNSSRRSPPQKVIVSEAGASVYSASELAAQEFPDLDVSLRGAVSIARRLQDPLAELVKIDPKSIGVGQYQHDVSQTQLARKLDAVVEDCVNAVALT